MGGSEEKEELKEALGKGLCPSIPPKFNLVGVVGAEAWMIGAEMVCEDADTGARGVVGVVAVASLV